MDALAVPFLEIFAWRQLLLGEEDWQFLVEVPVRAAIMFSITLATLRIIGKRGIMQGVFEIVTIITLGSAAGDPMFYKKVGLLPALLVFIIIILMYKLTNWIMARNKQFEHLIEGHHLRLITDGKFEIRNFHPQKFSKDEFFSDLRLKNITQLGQVKAAYVESTGHISVFYCPNDKVGYGLSILPEDLEKKYDHIKKTGIHACSFCGHTVEIKASTSVSCPVCDHQEWAKASDEKRIL